MKKRVGIILLIVAALSIGGVVTVVSADGPSLVGRGWRGLGRGWGALEEVADLLGLSDAEVRTAREAGKKVADLADEQGKDLDELVAQVIDQPQRSLAERIARQVAQGALTQEEADAELAQLKERLAASFRGEMAGRGDPRGGRGGPMERGMGLPMEAIGEALGLSAEDVHAALADGQTMADLIAAQGLEMDAVIERLLEPQAARLAQNLQDGKLTDVQVDALLALERARLEERLTATGAGVGDMGRGWRR